MLLSSEVGKIHHHCCYLFVGKTDLMEMQKVVMERKKSDAETEKTETDVATFGSDASEEAEIRIQSLEKVNYNSQK